MKGTLKELGNLLAQSFQKLNLGQQDRFRREVYEKIVGKPYRPNCITEGMKASRTVTLQGGKALVLLTLFVFLAFGLPMGLRALGAGHWLQSHGFGTGAFLYLFILCGLVLIVAITMAVRRTGLPGALLELGVLPIGLRGILVALLSVAVMIAVVLVSGRAFNTTAIATIISRDTVGPFAEEFLFRGFLFRQFRRWADIPF